MSETLAILLVAAGAVRRPRPPRRPDRRLGLPARRARRPRRPDAQRDRPADPRLRRSCRGCVCRRRRPAGGGRRWRSSVAGVATLLPWSVYNLSRFDEPVLLSTNDGNTLLGANCDSHVLRRRRRLGHPLPRSARARPDDASVRSQRAARRGVRLRRRPPRPGARRRRRPARPAARRLRPAARSSPSTSARRRPRWAVWAGIVGVVAARRRRRRRLGACSVATRASVRAGGWSSPSSPCCVTAVLFYGAHRIRAPAEPAVVLLAAVARRGRGRRIAAAGGTALAA